MAERVVKVSLTLSASQYQAELEKAKKSTESLGGAGTKVGKQLQDAYDAPAKSTEKLSKSASQFSTDSQAAFSASGDAAKKYGEQASTASKASSDAFKDASNSVAAFKPAVEASQPALDRMLTSARENREAWTTTGTALLAFGGSITAVGIAALKAGVAYNTLQQTTRAALMTMLGSAEAVEAQMSAFDAFAKTSPFARQVFLSAQQQLLGFGVEASRVIPILDAVQNAVAAVGGGNKEIEAVTYALAQMQGTGRLTGETLRDLGIYGIDAATIIGEKMGMTGAEIRKMASKPGGIPVDQVWDPLVSGMQEKFGGAADGVKNTFEGSIDRVKAAWRDFAADLAEPLVSADGGGFLIDLANKAADTMRAFQALPAPVKNTVTALGLATGAAAVLGGGLLLLVPRMVETWDGLGRMGRYGELAQSGLRKAGGAAVVAGKAFGVAAAAYGLALALDTIASSSRPAALGLEEVTAALLEGNSAAIYNQFGDATKNVGDALDTLLGQDFGSKANRFANGINNAFGGHLTDSVNDARKAMEDQGQALANLVGSGDAELAARLFEDIAAAAAAEGYSREQVLSTMAPYRDALAGVGNEQVIATEKTTALTEEQERAQKVMEAWYETAKRAGTSIGGVSEAYQAVIDASRQAAEEQAANTKTTKDAWTDYYNGFTVSHENWLLQMQEQRRSAENWATNYQTAIDQVRTMPEETQAAALAIIQDLTAKGAEGMPMLQAWVDGTPEWRQEMIDAFDGKALAEDLVGGTPPTIEVLADLDSADRSNAAWAARYTAASKANPAEATVDAETEPAESSVDAYLRSLTTRDDAIVPILSNVDPAQSTVTDWWSVLSRTQTNTKVGADDAPARQYVGGTIGWISRQEADVTAGADTSTATREINAFTGLTRSTTVKVNPDTGGFWGGIVAAISGRSVSVPVRAPNMAQERATGGPVFGPGSGTSDSIPAIGPGGSPFRLSNNEHVLTAAEVAAAGGHGAVYRLRRELLEGRWTGLANGGEVYSNARPYMSAYASPRVTVSAPGIDYGQLARAIARESAATSERVARGLSAGRDRSASFTSSTRPDTW